MWAVLDWMLRHVEEINEEMLLEKTQQLGDVSVLGVLADAANQRKPHAKWRRLMENSRPHRDLTIFFHRVAASPLASRLTRENALDLFRRWNYLCLELRYFEDGRLDGPRARPHHLARIALIGDDVGGQEIWLPEELPFQGGAVLRGNMSARA